jgi:hypothetical protein
VIPARAAVERVRVSLRPVTCRPSAYDSSNGLKTLIPGRRKSFTLPVTTVRL